MRLFPLVYEHKHAHAYTHTRAHTHHPLPPEKTAMGFLRRAAHFRPLRAAAFAPPTAATALPPACSPFGDHRALHRRERLVDRAVGHDHLLSTGNGERLNAWCAARKGALSRGIR